MSHSTLTEAYQAPSLVDEGLFEVGYGGDDEPDIFDLPVDDAPELELVAPPAPEPMEEPDEPVIEGGSVALRHYQQAAVRGVLSAFKGDKANDVDPVDSTLVVSATGTGKSVIIADLTRRNEGWGNGTLLLVHRDELIRQLMGSCARVGIHANKEKAQERALPGFGMFSKTVVASVQTMRGQRLQQWPRDSFKLIITDECFPAGTLVDGKPIEEIRVGDIVSSYNHQTGGIEGRPVKRLFKNEVKQLVRVHFSNGQSFVCTPEHPIAVQAGRGVEYLPAIETESHTIVHEENIYQAEIRVDRVEVLESGSTGRFAEVCSDGFVYNIEVEANHNYFVDGILVHNCHHAPSPSYMSVYDHFGVGNGGARHVGFTATADRLDGVGLGKVFESLAFEYNLRDAIFDPQGPYLVPIEAFPIETDPPIDLKDLRITAGDFNSGDLEQAINDNIGVLVNAIVDNNAIENRRTIAFTPNVASAQALALALQDVGITADWIAGDSTNRKEVLAAHRAGDIQVLVNCMILTEGYDDPEVSCILICRPTKSRSLYSQMVGRGTRLHPESHKNNCRIVDFAYMTGTHRLVSPVDLYDNSETDDTVIEQARELIKEGKERSLDAALDRAQREFEDGERVRIQRRITRSRAKSFDLMGSFELLGIRQKVDYNWNDTKAATPKMIEYARRVGVDLPDDAGFGATKKVLDAVSTRRQYGLSTMKQVATCIRLGAEPTEARKMSFNDASAYISSNKNW